MAEGAARSAFWISSLNRVAVTSYLPCGYCKHELAAMCDWVLHSLCGVSFGYPKDTLEVCLARVEFHLEALPVRKQTMRRQGPP